MKRLRVIGLLLSIMLLAGTAAHAGSVTGFVTVPNYTSGRVFVGAFDGPDPSTAGRVGDDFWVTPDLVASNMYTITGLAETSSAYVYAFWDVNGNADPTPGGNPQPDTGDYIGGFQFNPAYISGDLGDINISIVAQKADGFTMSGNITSSLIQAGDCDGSQGPIHVIVFDGADYDTATPIGQTTTWCDGSGNYPYTVASQAGTLGTGVYVAAFFDKNGTWGARPSPGDPVGEYASNPVTLAATQSNINIALESTEPGASLQGTVTSDGGSWQIGGIGVNVYANRCDWNPPLGSTVTDANGAYSIANLPPGAVYIQFAPEATNKNFIGGFYSSSGPVRDCGIAEAVTVSSDTATTINADLQSGPEPVHWYDAAVYNGTLYYEFNIYGAFREKLTGATLQFPAGSGRADEAFDLVADRKVWDSPCRYMDFWTKGFGTATANDYGTYTLTLTFEGNHQEVRTFDLQPAATAPMDVSFPGTPLVVNADGSAQIFWNQNVSAVGGNQWYQVRIREADTGREVFKSSDIPAGPTVDMSAGGSAQNLQCLEIGRNYRWLVRAYSEDHNHSATQYFEQVYNPSNLTGRAAESQVYAWKGGLLFDLTVRMGSIGKVTAATVTRPDSSVYTFDLTNDWYDGSTETRRYLKSWSHWENGPAPAGGTYDFSVTFSDGYVENFSRTLPDPIPAFSPVDIATMSAQVHPDGAITFRWDVPAGSETDMFQVRVRGSDGREYYKSPSMTGGSQVTAYFGDTQAMPPGNNYTWFVRHFDPTFQVMQESQRLTFFYDAWGISEQRPPEGDGYALTSGEFLYVTNEGGNGGGTDILQIAADGTVKVVGTGFFGPSGLAINPNTGNLFVSDDRSGIYEVTPGGTINRVLTGLSFSNPNALAFDSSGRLLVAEAGDSITRVDLGTETATVLAEGFQYPQGVGANGDDVYFTDGAGYVYRILGSDSDLPKSPSTVTKYTTDQIVPGTNGGLFIDPSGNVIVASTDWIKSVASTDQSVSTLLDISGRQFRGIAYSSLTNKLFLSVFDTNEIYSLPLGVSPPEPQVFAGAALNRLNGPFGVLVSTTDYQPFVSPLYADDDNDGVANPEDAFPDDPAASVDTDGDGEPDEWNPGKSQADSTSSPQLVLDTDDDDDTVGDATDNCRVVANTNQEDWNGDGVGDACDENIWRLGIAGQVTSSVWTAGQGNVYLVALNGPDSTTAQAWGGNQFSDAVPFDYTFYMWNGNSGEAVYVYAFWDANGNADPDNPQPDVGDYVSAYAGNPVTLADPGVPGVNLAIDQEYDPATGASLNASVMNVNANGTMLTFYDIEILNYGGSLPGDIDSYTVTGPAGTIATMSGADIAAGTGPAGVNELAFDPSYNGVFFYTVGSPPVGEYTFTVTVNGTTISGTDTQYVNRTLSVPGGLGVTSGAELTSRTPIFSWLAVTGATNADVSYRFQVRDPGNNDQLVVNTPRVPGMLFFVVPPGVLSANHGYEYRIRATDSDQYYDVQNRSHTGWVPFTMGASLNHAASPVFENDWGAITWTHSGGTSLVFSVTVTDPDGISLNLDNGEVSHTVTVTPPGGSPLNLVLEGGLKAISNGGRSANFGAGMGTMTPGTYSFTVTDPDGNTASTTDELTVAPLAVPDETSITPSLVNPSVVGVDAAFDNVYVNGSLYDDFATSADGSPDGTKWDWWGNGVINVAGGGLNLSTQPTVGRGDATVSAKNPAGINQMRADVTINSITPGASPRARINGYWFNEDGYDIMGAVQVRGDVITYFVEREYKAETYGWEIIKSGTLADNTVGATVTIGIVWDGTTLTFNAGDATATYTPTGNVLPARYPEKNLQVRTNLTTSVTPTFTWAAVPNAARYRVRIYNYDNSKTIWREWVTSQTTYTVPYGALNPSRYYRFRLEAIDADSDNYSRTPASGGDYYRFYTGLPGDVNGDGFVNLNDAISALQTVDGMRLTWGGAGGDVNADGRVGQSEALFILQDAAGVR